MARTFRFTTTRTIATALFAALSVMLSACSQRESNEVVIYCSVDQMHSSPILAEFERETGIRVKAVYDSEAVKTVGLVNRLRAESRNPQADVFWNNEAARSFQLHTEGVIDRPRPFAARARVLVYNTNLVQPGEAPRSIFDLADPKWRGKTGMAYPLFGTTATHAAALFVVFGDDRARAFFQLLKDNDVRIYEGNSTACEQVTQGHCAIGMTDTDDFWERRARGSPIEMVYPDQADTDRGSAIGCLVIPNTVSAVTGGRNTNEARRLVEYLHSRRVEEKLAFGPSRQIPLLGADVPVPNGVKRSSELRVMEVDYAKVAETLPQSAEFLSRLFQR